MQFQKQPFEQLFFYRAAFFIEHLWWLLLQFILRPTTQLLFRYKRLADVSAAVKVGHNYCRISPRHSEHISRLVVLSQQTLLRVEIIPNSILSIYWKMEMSMTDLFGSRLSFQIKKVLFRPTQFGCRCNAIRIEPGNSVRIYPVLIDSKSTL